MDDDLFDSNDPGSRELERRLRAYGDERLSPSAAATVRMRATVMATANRRAALLAADATTATIALPAIAPIRGHRGPSRRPVVALLAAVLTLGLVAGSVFAARPGGPLYGARIWAEMATLPSGGLARTEAELGRLETRLDEARHASATGDDGGVQAALEAYASIVEEAALGSRDDPAALAALETGVTNHVSVLTGLAETIPAPARSAIQHALSSSSKVLDDIDQKPPNGTDGGDPGKPGNAGEPGAPDATPTARPGKPTPDTGETAKPGKSGPPNEPPGNPDRPEPSRRP